MNQNQKRVIELYQCPGCSNGHKIADCFSESPTSLSCIKHCPGTFLGNFQNIFLGLPKGFDRLGYFKPRQVVIEIFNDLQEKNYNWGIYDKLNIPIWIYIDEHGNTIIKGFSPRIMLPFIHIFCGDVSEQIESVNKAIRITDEDLKEMD